MEVLIGLLSGVVFFVCLGGAFYAGWRLRGKQPSKHQEIDPEAKRRMTEFKEGMQNIMRYDVNQAMQRKKVT